MLTKKKMQRKSWKSKCLAFNPNKNWLKKIPNKILSQEKTISITKDEYLIIKTEKICEDNRKS